MAKDKTDKIFKAIADSKRRDILQMLVLATSALTINDISEKFDETRQAITKHVNTLHDAELINIERKGRQTFCTPNPAGLFIVYQWAARYQQFWTGKLDDLDKYLNEKT